MRLWTLLLPFLLSGCMVPQKVRTQELKTDLAFREMRSEIEDCKYQLNRFEVEIQIVEGKLNAVDASLNEIRQDLLIGHKLESDQQEQKIASLEKKMASLEKIEENLALDLKKLKTHANDTSSSLSQFKSKIDENEKVLSQSKKNLEQLRESINRPDRSVYVVQSGDSLEKIAKEHHTTVDQLKKMNNLKSDLIVIGQELQIK